MRIIFSRKGFDAGAGGVASPILPDGTPLSLPIPHAAATARYADLAPGGYSLGALIADLTRGRVPATAAAHLDPDLWPDAHPRRPGWRPAFGQTDAAQRHLERYGVDVGDLFLFFGWFREVESHGGHFRYVRGAPDQHVLFGWLEVGRVVRRYAGDTFAPDWAADHPHFATDVGRRNTVYLATAPGETAPGHIADAAPLGGGAFRHVRPELVLTAPGQPRRGCWRLPGWLLAAGGTPRLTYHARPDRWTPDGEAVRLRTSARGQEFVLDTADHPEGASWAHALVTARTD